MVDVRYERLYNSLASGLAEFVKEEYMRKKFGFSVPDYVGTTGGGDFCPVPLLKDGRSIATLYLFSRGQRRADYLNWFLEYHNEDNKKIALDLKEPFMIKGRKLLISLDQMGDSLEVRVGSRFNSFIDEGKHIVVPFIDITKPKINSVPGIDYSVMDYEQLKAEVEKEGKEISPSKLASKNSRLYRAVLDSKKMSDFEKDGVIVKKQQTLKKVVKPEEVKEIVEEKPEPPRVQQPIVRKLRAQYSVLSNENLRTIVHIVYGGMNISKLIYGDSTVAADPALYQEIRSRGLLEKFIEEGLLVRLRLAGGYKRKVNIQQKEPEPPVPEQIPKQDTPLSKKEEFKKQMEHYAGFSYEEIKAEIKDKYPSGIGMTEIFYTNEALFRIIKNRSLVRRLRNERVISILPLRIMNHRTPTERV